MEYFKTLEDGRSCHGGDYAWPLPQGDQPGEWTPHIERLNPCYTGYHLCQIYDLPEWFANEIYLAEPRGKIIEAEDKIVCQSARLIRRLNWDAKIAANWACDCAERVVHIYESQYPGDKRIRACIEMTRLFLAEKMEKIKFDATYAADAATRAATYATRAATRAAEKKWQTDRLREYLFDRSCHERF